MNALAKKLLIKPGQRWLFYNTPENYLATLEPLPEGTQIQFDASGSFDGVQLFVNNSLELAEYLKTIITVLKPASVFWVCYPKKSSGIVTDLEMMGNWDEPARYGLTTVAAASINETWTALRLKPAELIKTSEFCNEEIKQNEYSAYINPEKRQINLPADIQQVIGNSLAAMNFFESLSFSNRKEYVVWILSAKQEKTRTDRLVKLLDKLLAGKKNPSEK